MTGHFLRFSHVHALQRKIQFIDKPKSIFVDILSTKYRDFVVFRVEYVTPNPDIRLSLTLCRNFST